MHVATSVSIVTVKVKWGTTVFRLSSSPLALAACLSHLHPIKRDGPAGFVITGNRRADVYLPSGLGPRAFVSEPSTLRFCAENPASHSDPMIQDQDQGISDTDQDHSDVEESDEDEEDELRGENDEWSGQEDGLEAIVIDAVGEDLELAAYLIPLLHKEYHSDLKANLRQIVGPWCQQLPKCSPGLNDTGTAQTPSSTSQSNNGNGTSRKRQRRRTSSYQNRDVEDEDDEGDDLENQDPKGLGEPESGEQPHFRRLACPFDKKEPTKYCTQHGNIENSLREFRTCEGPGFKNIQRLKEHIKRIHYPVQCDRCYDIFPFSGTNRAAGVRLLEGHRQLSDSCARRESYLKEGISDAQCADLDKKKSTKKSLPTSSSVEKYWEIWDILFPTTKRSATPWYDGNPTGRRSGFEAVMQERVFNSAKQAFSLYIGLHGHPSSSNTSSSRSLPQSSLLSGSYEQVPTPRAQDCWTSPTPTGPSASRNHMFPMDIHNSPSEDHRMTEPRRQLNMPHSYINPAEMQPPPPNFPRHSMNINQIQTPNIQGFAAGMNTDVTFPSDPFNSTAYAPGQEFMYDFPPGSNLSTSGPITSFANGSAPNMSPMSHRPQPPRYDQS
ncbi:hypothetical protein VTL71DRAFT_6205 [Oculimacula yallundae]|uniref:C2H2-type domain-containing protein n=1 Tax=Oculimacula yallundae TaxID=86028 RepID=A0ABR4BZR5_9HELO